MRIAEGVCGVSVDGVEVEVEEDDEAGGVDHGDDGVEQEET